MNKPAGAKHTATPEAPHRILTPDPYVVPLTLYLTAFPTSAFGAGTFNVIWQCWHFTSFPRQSSGTARIFRHFRFGHIN